MIKYYELNKIYENKILLAVNTAKKFFLFKCKFCGRIFSASTLTKRCFCISHKKSCDTQRFSGKRYKNPPEKIEAIKEKYKNGVTPEILAELENKLKYFL